MSSDEVKNKLKTLTQGQKSDTVLGNMASTFKALCALADWNKQPVIQSEESQEVISHVENPVREAPFPTQNKLISDMNLHYNIQIHLPETTNMAVYDAIFQSLKKTLERSRNVIMHSGQLSKKDIERIGTNIRDWISQVGA